jgi:hypothetical protein
MLLPSELTEEALESLGHAFPARGPVPHPGALFRAIAERLQRLRLPEANVEAEASSAQGAAQKGKAELAPSPSDTRPLVVRREELLTLGVQPYVRIEVRKGQTCSGVRLALEPAVAPRRPGRRRNTQRGRVEIRLIRPAPKEAITVRLGSHETGEFVRAAGRLVRDYWDGEERQWEAEVSVHAGSLWKRQESETAALPLAASEGPLALAEERLQEQLSLMSMGTFECDDTSYEALADSTGQVCLTPLPEPGRTRLVLDGVPYTLERIEGEEVLCRVIGLGRGRLGLFFARRRREKNQHHIGFA